LTIIGGQGGEVGTCDATVALGVAPVTAGPAVLDIPAGQAPKAVWICPGTKVVLLWDSTDSGTWTVDIEPDLGTRPPHGYQLIPDPASLNAKLKLPIDRSTKYSADTQGGACIDAHDEVSINVVSAGDEFEQKATYQPEFGYWSAYLPPQVYDQTIKVSDVIIDTGQPDSITHSNWRVDHKFPGTPPVGTPLPTLNAWFTVAGAHTLPGEYIFTPMPYGTKLPQGETEHNLYFRLRVAC
jgi:hypothetical protein